MLTFVRKRNEVNGRKERKIDEEFVKIDRRVYAYQQDPQDPWYFTGVVYIPLQSAEVAVVCAAAGATCMSLRLDA